MKSVLSWGIRGGIAAGIFAFLFWQLGTENVIGTLAKTKILYLLPIAAMIAIGVILSSVNDAILLKAFSVRLGFLRLTYRVVQSWLFSFVFPSKMGEFSLMYLLTREKIPLGQSTAVVFLDKAITGMVAAAFAVLGVGMLLQAEEKLALLLVVAIGAIVGLGLFTNQKGRWIIRNVLPKIITNPFRGFGESLNVLLRKYPHLVAANVTITVVKHLLTSVLYMLAFMALGQQVQFLDIVVISAISFIISLIPLTIGGLGLREGSAIILYERLNIPGEITFAAYLIITFAVYSVIAAGLAILYIRRKNAEG